jgi:hypothetical protein
VEVEAPWTAAAVTANAVLVQLVKRTVSSASLQKILTCKFQKPKAYILPYLSSWPIRVKAVLGKQP